MFKCVDFHQNVVCNLILFTQINVPLEDDIELPSKPASEDAIISAGMYKTEYVFGMYDIKN